MSARPSKNYLQKYSAVFFSFIMFLGVCLRLYQMDRGLGGGDENHMLLYFGYTHLQYIATTYFDAANHIFHTMLVNLMGRWFGEDNALAIRFPSFLFGIATLWMIYKVAQEIFASEKIALIALLISAINPVHIHYSQTARGYSLMIFFSAAMVYFLLKKLQSKPNPWNTILFVFCGFFSVYTLPTNVFFLAGLAGWLLAVLFIPSWTEEQNLTGEKRKQGIFWFVGSALLMILLILFSYLPVLNQMIETARAHSLLTFDVQSALVSNLIPAIAIKILQGPLIWFLPLLFVGLIYGKVQRRSYLFLPIFVFLIPLIITQVIGVGGFPRNYLFNFPFFTLFLAVGFFAVSDLTLKWTKSEKWGDVIPVLLVIGYSLVSLAVVIFEHYPSLKTPDGELYKENIRQNSESNDLFIINDARDYLYARTAYKAAIQNILQENKLSGVKFIKQSQRSINGNEGNQKIDMWSLLKKIFKEGTLHFNDVSGGREMAGISWLDAVPIVPDDFGSRAQWQIVHGKGKVFKITNHRLVGKESLKLEASSQETMVVKTLIPGERKVLHPSFIVVALATKNFNPKNIVYHPLLTTRINNNGKLQKIKLQTKKINDGINLQIKENINGLNGYYWKVNAFFGFVPPGSYRFELLLKCAQGNSILYDGLRIFLINKSKTS